MRYGILVLSFFLLTLCKHAAFAQFSYQYKMDIPVSYGSKKLLDPWNGGIDLGQYNVVHLNEDNIPDLVIFDRHNNKASTYLADGTEFRYSPWLEHLLPSGLRSWVLFRDFNCDGKQDIFTSSLFGMSLYENTSTGSSLSWELRYSTIFTEGGSGQVNLQVNSGDLPSINDVDGDGDLDILVFEFAVGGGVNFHKNMSMERTGTCGIDFVFEADRYGDFEECTCDTYVFGAEVCPDAGRLEHIGGKSILSYAFTGQSEQDLLIGQEDCTFYGFLENQGTVAVPVMSDVRFDFPNAENPVTLNYPAAYALDLDFDGVEDLLVTHNAFSELGNPNYANNNLFYKKTGTGYSLQSTSFLQDNMIDLGSNASPAFADMDSDGDEEMLVGTGTPNLGAKLYYFANVGDALNPELALQNSDFLGLEADGSLQLKPQFIDLNQNGYNDLLVFINTSTATKTRVYWNSKNPLNPYTTTNTSELATPEIRVQDNPYLYFDDSRLMLLIGRSSGNLSQYVNRATIDNPQWELLSDAFLGRSENFMARSLSVTIDDLNGDGKKDLIAYDDSGEITIYTDYKNGGEALGDVLIDTLTMEQYNASFGTSARITTSKISGALLPSIVVGLRTGGVQLLSNLNDNLQEIAVPIRLSVFPNPVNNNELLQLVANKAVSVKIFDTIGNPIYEPVSLPKGERVAIELANLRAGLYLIQAVDSIGAKAAYKFIIAN